MAILLLGLAIVPAAPAQDVLTQHNDAARTGADLNETHLTAAGVKANFGKLFSLPVEGQIYAQPLVVNGVDIPGKGVHNVVYVATMENNVYAFDADQANQDCPLWMRNLGAPVPYQLIPPNPGSVLGLYNIWPYIGITSTPVIDPASSRMWVAVKTMTSPEDIRYYLYSLDIRTGAVLGTSQPIEAGDGVDKLQGQTNLQRPGLLREKGMIYLAFGGHQDGGHFHGWLVAFDQDTLEQKYVFCTTPGDKDGEGGIWQSGNGPAADADGNIYVMTGNGAFNANHAVGNDRQFGTSFIKLDPELNVVQWFTPSNYAPLSRLDVDLGSSGPMLIPDSNELVGGGKQGWFYLLDRNHFGGLQPKRSVTPALEEFHVSSHWTLNWISWLLPVFGYHHIHGAPVYWNSAQRGPLVYVWPEVTPLKAYSYDPVAKHFRKKPVMTGPQAPHGMPGGFLSISANGNQNGLLWATTPLDQNALTQIVRGTLRVFDANTLELLWSTDQNTPDDIFNFAKNCPPTIANSKVYLATFSDRLNVYGLLPSPPPLPSWATPNQPARKARRQSHLKM
jgi:outer membrane protein assembly factor BamB